jgi:hypothetical protein
MWQLLGLQPDALPAFAKAMLADHKTINGLRARTMSQLATSLCTIMRPPGMGSEEWRQKGMPVSLEAHSRQQQQLLQTVCWPLPELLLRIALLCGQGQPLIAEAATAAATWALAYWHADGMEVAAAAGKQQQLPSLLDCWLQLMQPLLVGCPHAAVEGAVPQQPGNPSQQQQPLALVAQAAATARLLPPDSPAAQQVLGALMCSCNTNKINWPDIFDVDNHGSSGSGSISSVRLQCDSLEAVHSLLACLGAMQVRGRGGVLIAEG